MPDYLFFYSGTSPTAANLITTYTGDGRFYPQPGIITSQNGTVGTGGSIAVQFLARPNSGLGEGWQAVIEVYAYCR
ncbi:MAG: hypothetical protein IPN94_17730 [Sphingobacteriales bacterium]|nr:hypothetical protein [Sphingobacteriales bacterium]